MDSCDNTCRQVMILAYSTKFLADPQQRGSRMMLGSKNNNCRVNDRKMALTGHADTLKKIGRYHLKPDNGKKYDYNA